MPAAQRIATLLLLLTAIACEDAPTFPMDASRGPALSMASGAWSEPVHLGEPVNSRYRELAPTLSMDGLALYFNSDRPTDGVDRDPRLNLPFDIYVSRRACLECPWEPARNLGSPVNGPRAADNDGAAALSHDGHLLFWSSNREGSAGGSEDIWMARREDPSDDFGWGEPVNLGPLVNTALHESGPTYVVAEPGGHATLYFGRGANVWMVSISRAGVPLGEAVPVPLLGGYASPSVRLDGREMVLWSSSKGGLGQADVFVSTRANPTAPWSEPANIGAPVNTAGGELEAAISFDGMTLVFSGTETRGFSLGRQDIWMAVRTRGAAVR